MGGIIEPEQQKIIEEDPQHDHEVHLHKDEYLLIFQILAGIAVALIGLKAAYVGLKMAYINLKGRKGGDGNG